MLLKNSETKVMQHMELSSTAPQQIKVRRTFKHKNFPRSFFSWVGIARRERGELTVNG